MTLHPSLEIRPDYDRNTDYCSHPGIFSSYENFLTNKGNWVIFFFYKGIKPPPRKCLTIVPNPCVYTFKGMIISVSTGKTS